MRYYDQAQHLGDTGHARWDLAVRHGEAEQEAASRLAGAVTGHTDTYMRSRAMSGIKLASLTMTVGDPQEAAVIGAQALQDARSLRSRSAADDLRDLARRARSLTGSPRSLNCATTSGTCWLPRDCPRA
jgi:hypothetical protein